MVRGKILPGLTVLVGVAGLAVRRLYLTVAFDPVSGLPLENHRMLSLVLWGLALVVLAAWAFGALGMGRDLKGRYSTAFRPEGMLCLLLRMAGAALLVLGGFLNAYTWVSSPMDAYGHRTVSILRLILGLVCLWAGASVALSVRSMGKKEELRGIMPLGPGFACCLWVMANYQNWAKDPVLEDYVFSMLAVLLSMAACYLHASFAFGKARVGLSLTVSAVAVVLNLMVLADASALEDVSLHLALAFYLLSMLLALVRSAGEEDAPACAGGPACETCPGCPPAEQ